MAALQKHTDPITGKMIPAELLTNGEIGSILPFLEFAAPWSRRSARPPSTNCWRMRMFQGGNWWRAGATGNSLTQIRHMPHWWRPGYKKALFYERIPVTLTEAEKLINKDDFNTILMPFIVKPKGKPTLGT